MEPVSACVGSSSRKIMLLWEGVQGGAERGADRGQARQRRREPAAHERHQHAPEDDHPKRPFHSFVYTTTLASNASRYMDITLQDRKGLVVS